MRLVTKADIDDAANRISGAVLRTPLVPTTLRGRRLWLKPENLQAIGAFKVRGATNVLATLPESARDRGVVAYSSGNHAQAVAQAAQLAGVPAVIVID
ncbi:MAG TPA: pyridoxal-phosphate dependent enzyme, partial [Pseudonocardiaceae bacterium]